MKFKERSQRHNIKVKGKAASYPEAVAKIIEEGGCTKQLVLNAEETALCWKRCQLRLS